MAWKYIMMQRRERLYPVIFPDIWVHSAIMHHLATALWPGEKIEVISAGMIEAINLSDVGGESTSIGVHSRGDIDKQVVELFHQLHGIENGYRPSPKIIDMIKHEPKPVEEKSEADYTRETEAYIIQHRKNMALRCQALGIPITIEHEPEEDLDAWVDRVVEDANRGLKRKNKATLKVLKGRSSSGHTITYDRFKTQSSSNGNVKGKD